MKNMKIIFCIVCCLSLFACHQTNTTSFVATVLENEESTLMVEADEGEDERKSSDVFVVTVSDAKLVDPNGNELTIHDISPNAKVEIVYDGVIAESYPAQIHQCSKVVVLE